MASNKMNQGERIVRAGDFATRIVAGETILVPIRSGVADLECVYTLDEVASAIWRSLESPKTVEQVAGEIASEFDVDEGEARRDVAEFLAALKSSKLAVEAGNPGEGQTRAK